MSTLNSNFSIGSFHPFRDLYIQLPTHYDVDELISHISVRDPILGSLLESGEVYFSKFTEHGCSLSPRLLGGKGGFGSQLRAAGGRMSSQRTDNKDSCRDLDGRRLSTVKEAKRLAEYIEGEADRKKNATDERKKKIEKLERRIKAAEVDEDGASSSGQKRRLEDTEYVEQSKELVEGVKNAVAAGLLRKKKKAKTDTQSASRKATSSSTLSSNAATAGPAIVPVELAPVAAASV